MVAIAAMLSIASFSQDKAGRKDTAKHLTLYTVALCIQKSPVTGPASVPSAA